MLWVHHEDEGLRAEFAPRIRSGRGVFYWTDGREARIIYVTTGYRMKALDARSGAPISSFGADGVIDLKKDFDQDLSRFARPGADALTMADIGLHASPVIRNDTIVVGAAGREGTTPYRLDEVKGYVRAFDVRTGKRLWTFPTVPKPREFGCDTWQNGADLAVVRTGQVVRSARAQQAGPTLQVAHVRYGTGRHELAGRIVRPRDAYGLCLGQSTGCGPWRAAGHQQAFLGSP